MASTASKSANTNAISERLQNELDLLSAMYPDATTYDSATAELIFKPSPDSPAKLMLRLPPSYPDAGVPTVLEASDNAGQDIRQSFSKQVDTVVDEAGGEGEVLDAIISHFAELVDSPDLPQPESAHHGVPVPNSTAADVTTNPTTPDLKHLRNRVGHKTVIIWLHHLLNTNKRKLALHPTISPEMVSGVTKPGYPGVLLYTGAKEAVEEHVRELKGQNWQAFSVRYEGDEKWQLGAGNEVGENERKKEGKRGKGGKVGRDDQVVGKGHVGKGGIVEVESISEIVKGIVDEDKKEAFLKAVGVK